MTPEELALLKQSAAKYDYVRFTIADICGGSRGHTVTKRHVDKFLQDGIGLYSGTVSLTIYFPPKCMIYLFISYEKYVQYKWKTNEKNAYKKFVKILDKIVYKV